MESNEITPNEKQETQKLIDIQLQRTYHIIHECVAMCFPKNFTATEVQKIAHKAMNSVVEEINNLLIAKTIDNETTARNSPADC